MTKNLTNQQRIDSWINLLTGYGGVDDPMANTRFSADILLSRGELEGMYNHWIGRKGIEIPVNDRLSNGVTFITNEDDTENRLKSIEQLEVDIRTTQMWQKIIQAEYWARLYGGGLLFFDYGDGEESRFELRDGQRGIPNKIWVTDRNFAIPASYYTDAIHGADHPKRGEVEVYNLSLHTTGWARQIFAHESRVIKFDGLDLAQIPKAANHMWGWSVMQSAEDILKFHGVSLKAMADTFEDFNWKTLQIEKLADLIEANTKENLDTIIKSIGLAAKNYHNQSIGVHAPETELKRHTTTVTGLAEMSVTMSNLVPAAFYPGIPDSIFFSAKGGALGGTSAENDTRNYYQKLRHLQKHQDSPKIERFLFLLGYEPADFPFLFPEMEEPTELEKIEAREKQAAVDEKYISMNVVTPEEVRLSRFSKPEPELNQMIIDMELTGEIDNNEEDNPPDDLRDDKPPSDKDKNRTDTDDITDFELIIE